MNDPSLDLDYSTIDSEIIDRIIVSIADSKELNIRTIEEITNIVSNKYHISVSDAYLLVKAAELLSKYRASGSDRNLI